jgi:hypothetical protein
VTAAGTNVTLDSSGAARAPFMVTNTSAQTLKGRLIARPTDPAKPEWFSIVGESVRDFAPNAAQQVVVELSVPPGSQPGSYSFHLDAVSQVDPDEDFTEGPSVAFEVAPAPEPKKPFPWWILAVVGGVVLLIIIAVVVFLLVRDTSPKVTVVSSGLTDTPGSFFDLDTGTLVIRQTMQTDIAADPNGNALRPVNGATALNIGVRNFDEITPEMLSQLKYSTAPIPGQQFTQAGDAVAVHTTEGNFAKFTLTRGGSVQWITYKVKR